MTEIPDVQPQGDPISSALQQKLSTGETPYFIKRQLFRDEAESDAGGGALLGIPAAVGGGFASSVLGLARGANFISGGAVAGGPNYLIPQSLSELLPEDYALRFESRLARAPKIPLTDISARKPAEVAGEVLGLVGGPAGKAIEALSWPGAAAGRALSQLPSVAKWTLAAKNVEGLVGGASGFGLYNYITADGDMKDRVAAGLQGAAAGALLSVAHNIANAAEGALLNSTLSESARGALADVAATVRTGKLPAWDTVREAFREATAKGAAKGVGALIEGTGFAGMNGEFWRSLFSDDPKGAVEAYVGSVAGALLARTGRPDAYLWFRRDPTLNNTNLRFEADGFSADGAKPQDPQGPQGPITGLDKSMAGVQPSVGVAPDAVAKLADPLFLAGFDAVPGSTLKDGRSITVKFPGAEDVHIGEGFIDVPAAIFNQVRGGDAKNRVRMEGPEAEEFARDLASMVAIRRMAAQIRFAGNEAWAGGPFDGQNGKLYQIGLDGSAYTREWGADENEPWQKVDLNPPRVSAQTDDPALGRWVDLVRALRGKITPTPGLDVMDTAVLTAINGNPESAPVKELQQFLTLPWSQGQSNADALAQVLRPDNIDQVGLILGKIGAGSSTARTAFDELNTALQPPKPSSREGEAGFVGTDLMHAVAEGAVETVKKAGRYVKATIDETATTRAETFQEATPESTLPYEGRKVLSDTRVLEGAARAKFKPAEKAIKKLGRAWWKQQVDLPGDRTSIPRWEQVFDTKLPATKEEQPAYNAAQATLLHLWDAGRMAGIVRAENTPQGRVVSPLPQHGRGIVPRVPGKDAPEIFADPAQRRRLWQWIEDHNQGGPTAAQLEASYEKEFEHKADVKTHESETAIEMLRQIEVVPAIFEGKQLRESNPFKVFDALIRRQAARVSFIGTFGQDLSAADRKLAEEWLKQNPNYDLAPNVRTNLAREGGPARLARYRKELSDTKLHPERKEALENSASEWFDLMQGKALPSNTFLRAVSNVDAPARAALASTAFVWDIPELGVLPTMYGGTRGIAAIRDFLRSPIDMVRAYERLGAVTERMIDSVIGDSPSASRAIATVIGFPGTLTEKGKQTVIGITADKMMESWDAGEPHSNDPGTLIEMGFSPQQAQMLITGRADPSLRNQFRNELVQLLSSKRKPGEGPRFSDRPAVKSLFRFVNFAMSRIAHTLRNVHLILKSIGENGVFSAETIRRSGRLAKLLGGFTVAGLAGQALGYMVSAMISGQNPKEGIKRFMREWNDSMLGTMGTALLRQTVGGPLLSVGMAISEGTAKSLAQVSVLGAAILSLHNAWQAATSGDWTGVAAFLRDQGYVPGKFYNWIDAAFAGHVVATMNAKADRAIVQEFERSRGIQHGTGPHTHDPDFYIFMRRAMGTAMEVAEDQQNPETATFEPAVKAAMEELRRAAKLASGDSMASWLMSQRHLRMEGWTNETIADFSKYLGDKARLNQMLQHDEMLRQLAKAARKLEGYEPTEWEKDVESLRAAASTGVARWDNAIDRGIRIASEKMERGQDPESDLHDLAMVMAEHPEQLGSVLGENQMENAKAIFAADGSIGLYGYMQSILLQRASDRINRKAKEAAQEAR